MKYAADVLHHSARPHDYDRFSVAPVEGATPIEAARKVAEIAAARRFEETGCVGFLSPTGDPNFFRASIGEQLRSNEGIALRGVTISIHVWPVE